MIMKNTTQIRRNQACAGVFRLATTAAGRAPDAIAPEARMDAFGARLGQWLGRIAVLACALGAMAIVPSRASAFGSTDKGDGNHAADIYGGGDDETVGTLPIVLGEQTIKFRRNLNITRPSVCLEGDVNEILNSIAIVRGDTSAKLEWLDVTTYRARVTFPNDVLLGFDRLALQSANVRIGMNLPVSYAYPIQDWSGSFNSRHVAFSPALRMAELPVAALASSGTLDQHPMHVQIGNLRTTTSLIAFSSVDFVTLLQTH
jgi:hypothetical protein